MLKIIKGGGGVVPMPYVHEIFLIECRIAGTTYVDEIEEKTAGLVEGSVLTFRRESENRYDPLAIRILNEKGEKIGYVPRDKNEVLARLMDGGKLIFGQIVDKQMVDNWMKIRIKVFLKDM